MRIETYAGEAVKDVDVVARVEVVDGTLAVDLERVLGAVSGKAGNLAGDAPRPS